jgi:hypothetical protein
MNFLEETSECFHKSNKSFLVALMIADCHEHDQSELHTPTRAREVPMKIRRWAGFPASAFAALRRDKSARHPLRFRLRICFGATSRRPKTANPPLFHCGAARRHRSSLKLPSSLVSYGGSAFAKASAVAEAMSDRTAEKQDGETGVMARGNQGQAIFR